MDRSIALLLDELASRQSSLVTRRQLLDVGVSSRRVDSLVERGHLRPVHRGIYRVAGAEVTLRSQIRTALLAGGPGAVASHSTAAALLGLDGFTLMPPIQVTVAREHRGRRSTPGIEVHSAVVLERIDRTVVDGLPCTSAARTVIDLAAVGASAHVLGNAIDSAARLGLATGGFVGRRLDVIGRNGRRGVALLDAVTLDAGGHSFLERRFLRLMREAKLRRPVLQVAHPTADGRVRVDFEWKPERVIAEVNGRRGHAGDGERAKDARRRNALQRDGFEILEFVTTQVIGEPDYVIAVVAEALHHRGRQQTPVWSVPAMTTSTR